MVDQGMFGGVRRRLGTAILVVLVFGSSFAATRWIVDGVLSPGTAPSDLWSSSGDDLSAYEPPTSLPFDVPEFRDAAGQAGIDFTHDNGAIDGKIFVETTGGGAGWLDYDHDGHCDLYLVQGGAPRVRDRSDQPGNRLYRNLGDGTFHEVGRWAGIDDRGYGQGVAVADFDDDGFDDIYVTNVATNVLFHNMGDGTFRNVTESGRIDDLRWSTSAAWADLDQDGDLDLYVCNYVKYDVFDPVRCTNGGRIFLCSPDMLDPVPDSCFFNQGDGTFRELAANRGLRGKGNRALGVVVADLVNNDGAPDVYVANDTTDNFLFVNNGTGHFTDQALKLGCAGTGDGAAQGSMGVAVADFDRNHRLDLYVTNFSLEYDTLYQNNGGQFADASAGSVFATPTDALIGWGTVMSDFNLDGRCDLFATYGGVDDLHEYNKVPPKMAAQLFTFQPAKSEWVQCTMLAGPFFRQVAVGRGVAAADYDNDGDLDLCVVHQNSPTALLENVSKRGHWLKLRLIGRSSNRTAIGARVRVTQGKRTLYQELAGGTSYCASPEPVLIFGLGDSDLPCSTEIQWPSGITENIPPLHVDQELLLIEGHPQPLLTHNAGQN